MIIGIGTDIIEISRVRRAVANAHFKDRVYTKNEQAYCDSRGQQSAASYAARFAAKEAFFKAIGTGIITRLTDVEVVKNEMGQPEINLHGNAKTLAAQKHIGRILLSISHSQEYATAIVVIDGGES